MPLPVHVALVGTTSEQVWKASKHFRLSAPGIGPAYLAALDAASGGKVLSISELPPGRIDLWVCLDSAALIEAEALHQSDRAMPRYGRGFYEVLFPEACILIDTADSDERSKLLVSWAQRIMDAWQSTG